MSEQQFKPGDVVPEVRRGDMVAIRDGRFVAATGHEVRELTRAVDAEQPPPVDVPVGSRWRNARWQTVVVERIKDDWVSYGGMMTGMARTETFLANYTRIDAPAEPEQFTPRVARWEDCKPGAVLTHDSPAWRARGAAWAVTAVGGDAVACDTPEGHYTAFKYEIDAGSWTLIRPAPEVSEAKVDPRALRKGDAVTFPGQTGAFRYIVDRFDGSRMWWGHGGMCAFEALHHAAHVNGTPIADWVRDVQPGRLAEEAVAHARSPEAHMPTPAPDGYRAPERDLLKERYYDEAAPFTAADVERIAEAVSDKQREWHKATWIPEQRPTCAACSRPIAGRPLELDEGAVKLCPGDARDWDACVNKYARRCREAQQEKGPGLCVDMDDAAWPNGDPRGHDVARKMRAIQYRNEACAIEAGELRAQARDAAAANEWHRGVGMCGPWVKGGR